MFSTLAPPLTLAFLLLAASKAAAVVVRLKACNMLFCICFFEMWTVCFSMFDRIFFDRVLPDLLVFVLDSKPSLKAVILTFYATELVFSLGIFAEGSSLSIYSKNGFKGPLTVHVPICVPKSSMLSVGLGTCMLILFVEFSDLICPWGIWLSLNLRRVSAAVILVTFEWSS